MVDVGFRTKTPNNVGQSDQKQFFQDDTGASAGILEEAANEGSTQGQKAKAAEDAASGRPRRGHEQMEDHHLMMESRSRDGSHAHATSSISISRS